MGKHKSNKPKKIKRHKKKSKRSLESSSEEDWVERKIGEDFSSDEKTVEKKRRRYRSSSRDSASSSENEESYKKNKMSKCKSSASGKKYKEKPELLKSEINSEVKRDDWMNLPTSFSTSSTLYKKSERELQKRLQRERDQYNPRECSEELNPYWKDGGNGLPNFKKTIFNEEEHRSYKSERNSSRSSNWRRTKELSKHSDKSSCTAIEEQEKTIEVRGSGSDTECINITEKELNILAAKIVKAEILGNTKLIGELKEQLEHARKYLKQSTTNYEEVILTHTDSKGISQPLRLQSDYNESSTYKKKKKVETHEGGERVRYFADDDKYSLKQMFENEKYNSVEDQNKEFLEMTSKISKQDDLDDLFSDNIRKGQSDFKLDGRNRDRAIDEHKKVTKNLDKCNHCIQSESMLKHLMISMNETVYISLPSYEPLTNGHCLIVPIRHVPCSTQLDENEWSDIQDIRRALVKLFISKNEDVIFFEYAKYLHKFPHMYIECIPLPKEDGDMAPIYFKKAIEESETEWSQNKKLVSLKGRDIRKAIPKGLPYFFVSFGMEEGYAHVIEDEELFPNNFAQEVIGGMLDVHHSKWRRPKTQQFQEQSKRVLEFSKEWKNFDCTSV